MANRTFYAVQQVGVAQDGSTTYTPIHGLQRVSLSTNFNLEDVFEIGQISIYEQIENLPAIEAQLEKVIDGYPLIYHLCTRGSTGTTLAERSVPKCSIALSIFSDAQNAASGTPLAEVNCSGMFVSNLSYTIPTEGNSTESVTLVGNNKLWKTSSFTFTGQFNDTDTPQALASGLGGVQRRENVVFAGTGSNYTRLPGGTNGIPGISSSGTNDQTAGQFGCHVSKITVNCSLNRTDMLELGRRNPYNKYVNFPVDVTTDIEIIATQGDNISATETGVAGSGNNLTEQTIIVYLEDTTKFNMGTKNKLQSVSYGGADTGGGNAAVTYSYLTKNNLSISNTFNGYT